MRKLRLAECFDNISKNALDKDISPQPLAKNEPKFYPIKDKNKELNQFIDFLIICILKTLTNLSDIILIKNSGLSLIKNQSADLQCKSIDWFLYDDKFGV